MTARDYRFILIGFFAGVLLCGALASFRPVRRPLAVTSGATTLSHPLVAKDVSAATSGTVYVIGQVHSVGAVNIAAGEKLTLSHAILLDGGFGDFADLRKIKVMRTLPDGSSQITIIDLQKAIDSGNWERDMTLESGDTILVPQRFTSL